MVGFIAGIILIALGVGLWLFRKRLEEKEVLSTLDRIASILSFVVGIITLIISTLNYSANQQMINDDTMRNNTISNSTISNSTILQAGGDIITAPTSDPLENVLDSVAIENTGDEMKNVLVAYNAKGDPIRRIVMDANIAKAAMDDIDGDGNQEIFVGLSMPGDRSGYIVALDEKGNEIAQTNTWMESIYKGAAEPKARVVDFLIDDLLGDGHKKLVVISDDIYWYASRVLVYSFDRHGFSLDNVFWNPGLLYSIHMYDLDNDRTKEIIVTGTNNDLQAVLPLGGNVSVAFLLEGKRISGEAPPRFGRYGKGSEKWYAYFTPSEVNIVQSFYEDYDHDGIRDIQISLEDACSYYLDVDGNLFGYGLGTGCKKESRIQFVR